MTYEVNIIPVTAGRSFESYRLALALDERIRTHSPGTSPGPISDIAMVRRITSSKLALGFLKLGTARGR
jgi:hypothetical protein